MSRAKIFALYVIFNLLIIGGVLWCAFARWPVRQYLIPAMVLFVLSGLWLIIMTVRSMPPNDKANGD